jgi:hypothetical protein
MAGEGGVGVNDAGDLDGAVVARLVGAL